jgi:hypothetical protein
LFEIPLQNRLLGQLTLEIGGLKCSFCKLNFQRLTTRFAFGQECPEAHLLGALRADLRILMRNDAIIGGELREFRSQIVALHPQECRGLFRRGVAAGPADAREDPLAHG